MQLFLAIRAFTRVLFDRSIAEQVANLLETGATPRVADEREKVRPVQPERRTSQPPHRNDAVTLLATLQREARFVDIVKEPLAGYSDAQIGAAARDVLRDCGTVLERLFDLQPLTDQDENSSVEVSQGYDTGRYRLVGNVQGEPPFQGKLVHHGWETRRCDLPQWSGSKEASNVVAPMEVEVS